MATRVRIEPMAEGDWPEVRRIYAEGIATGDATFETEVPDWCALGPIAPAEMPPRRARSGDRDGRRLDGAVARSRRGGSTRGVAWESVYVADAGAAGASGAPCSRR